MIEERIKASVRDIHNFPKDGIVFKDITPILSDPELVRDIISELKERVIDFDLDAIACIESRGFWFGTMLAYNMGLPIIPIRKKGKLPYETVSVEYDLEYGSEIIEAHSDAIKPGSRILVHDDLLATGGTASAAARLIDDTGGNVVGFSFLIKLSFLTGQQRLTPYNTNIISLIDY